MAIYKGDVKVSGNAMMVALPMFYATYQPRKLNNASWLRADPYSWHSADVYVSAYAHLADNISGVTAETETIAGTTITFYPLSDEIKVVLPDQETNLDTIYNATGIGYYFVLDTTNRQFKLPRNIYGFTGYRGDVGGYVAESLPSFVALCGYDGQTGAYRQKTVPYTYRANTYQQNSAGVADIDVTYGSEVANKKDAPVQQRATQAYLYFYVGNTVQNETSVDVAEMTEAINDKVDLSSSWGTLSTTYDDLTEPSNNGYVDITAPADGWLYYARRKDSGNSNTNMWAINTSHTETFQVEHDGYWGGTLVAILFPVKKGNTIRFGRNNLTGNFMGCRFYYAQKTN